MTAPLYHQDNQSMNHNQHRVSRLLLAAAMALPLAAFADEADGAPTMHADAGPPAGPEAVPGNAGPGMPPHFDGMRGGCDGAHENGFDGGRNRGRQWSGWRSRRPARRRSARRRPSAIRP